MPFKLKIQSASIRIISICIGLTFVPIILSITFWIVNEWWKWELDSILSPDIIRAILFILIADLAMIVSGILVFFAYPMLKKKIHIRLSATTIIILLTASITAGLLIDYYFFYIGSGGIDAAFTESYNFVISFPAFLLLLIIVIHLFKIKSKAVIIALSVVVSVLFMIFTFWFYAHKLGGPPTEFYGLVYVIAFVPALIIGLTYGLAISNRLDTSCGNR